MWSQASTDALLLSIKVSLVTTVIMVLVGTPIAFRMVRKRGVLLTFAESILSLPLVIPPVVTGYCLLVLFSPAGILGKWLDSVGMPVIFNWKGAVVASGIMAFPLYLAVAKVAFERCDRDIEDAARTLNAGPLRVMVTITLPLAAPGLLAAAAVSFARAFGEFGATIMLAGNIPGQTQTVSQAIFTDLMAGKDQSAMGLVLITIVVGMASMIVSQLLIRRSAIRGDGGRRSA